MTPLPQQPRKPLQYDCASCGDSLVTGRGQPMCGVVTCGTCGTVCALDEGAARNGVRMAVKVVPTGSAAIMPPN